MPLKLIQLKPGGNFYVRGTVAGRKYFKSTGLSDRKAAEALRIRIEAEALERHALGDKATATFAEAAVNYMESGGERRFLAPLIKHFGATRLSEIDNRAINAAARAIYPNAKPSTINRQVITPMSAILTMDAEDRLCDPVRLRRRKVKAQKTRWLTPEEFDALADELPPHLQAIIGFQVATGARVRETLSLQISTLYLSAGQALLTETKNGKPRMVEIPDRAIPLILARELPDEGTAFRNHRGEPYQLRDNTGGQYKTSFNKARDRAGLGRDVTPHTVRHTWATWYHAQTGDFGRLLDLGGWSDADTANIYRKIAPEDLGDRLLKAGWDFRRGFQRGGERRLSIIKA